MRKQGLLNIISLICLMTAVFFICYFLLRDDIFPFSIRSVWSYTAHHWPSHFHMLAVGFLPIYVALMIFGTAIVVTYFGSILKRWISSFHLRSGK